MREALFSQDGWGCQHVNQDTNWEIPSSPEPSNKDPAAGPPLWKPTVNNGTDLWESNLRNGGQPPAQPVQKTPWGHTPSSNLGGTWGEDDDVAESGSVWTGSSSNAAVPVSGVVPSSVVPKGHNAGAQWNQNTVNSSIGGGASAVPAAGSVSSIVSGKIEYFNGKIVSELIEYFLIGPTNVSNVNVPTNPVAGPGNVGASGNGWGDPRDIRPIGAAMDMRNVDPRDSMRAASAGDPRMLDPRDSIRGDPRGISGRLNGTSEMWGQHHNISHGQIGNMNKIVGPGGVTNSSNVSSAVVAGGVANIGTGVGIMNPSGVASSVGGQWGTGGGTQPIVGSKDLTAISSKQISGWEEPSPPPQRRNIPNYDDGTSLWSQQARGMQTANSHWKDISDPRAHIMRSNLGNHSSNSTNGGVAGNCYLVLFLCSRHT